MIKKILQLFLVLIIIIGICKSIVGEPYSYQAEDIALVKAGVLGFDRDESNNSIILLRINEIINYFHNESALYEPLKINQSVRLGFLWGHGKVTPTNDSIDVGDKILARVGYHYNFTAHNGHLYSYEKICGDNEIKINGECYPSECDYDEHLVNNRCVKLNCEQDEKIANHTCVALNCEQDEMAKHHECIKLECGHDEYPTNHTCKKLVCGEDERVFNYTCSKLNCNILQKASSHTCVLNWDILWGIFLFFVAILFFWYEDLLKRIEKLKIYKKLISNETFVSLLVVVLTILVLTTPLLIRAVLDKPLLIGEEPYLHAKVAQDMLNGKIHPGLVDQKINLYQLLLVGLGSSVGVYLASVFVPPLLGILSMFAIVALLRRSRFDLLTKSLMLVVLAISPAFLYLFTFSTPHALAVFLTLVGLNLLMKNRRLPTFFSLLLFLLASLNSVFNLTLCSGILLFFIIKKKRRRVLLVLLLILLLLLTLPYHILTFTARDTIYQFQQNILIDSITSFGALIGFSIFNLVLALFGFAFTWKKKGKYAIFYLIFLALFVVGLLLNKNYNMYWNFVVAHFAGLGFVYLLKAEWELKLVKQLTILVIVCGLIFSTVSYTKLLVAIQPTKDVFDSLKELEKEELGLVLSHHSRGYWIGYLSRKQAFVDNSYSHRTQELLNISDEVFYSRDLVYTKELLDNYNITHIFIDKEMRQGLVWVKEEQGLLFLFRNNETFKKLHSNPSTEIWGYIKG